MDDYPAAEDIPNPLSVETQHHELLEFLVDNDQMKDTAKHSLKQGLWAGGGAVAGGMLFGPAGGLVGGIVGSVVGFFQSDDYEGAVQQILVLEDTHKERLVQAVQKVLITAGATARNFESADAFRGALVQFAAQRPVREQVWKACLEAIES